MAPSALPEEPLEEPEPSDEADDGAAPKEIVLALASDDAGLRSAAQRILSSLYPDWARSIAKRQVIVPLLAGLRTNDSPCALRRPERSASWASRRRFPPSNRRCMTAVHKSGAQPKRPSRRSRRR